MKESHTMDILFVLCLFLVFTASAISVVMIGSHVYSQSVNTMETMHNNETALNYLVEKVRLHNDGHVTIMRQADTDVLCLNEGTQTNYLYVQHHYLYEYTGSAFAAQKGQKLIACDRLALQKKHQLLSITLTIKHKTQSAYVALVGRDQA